MKGDNDRQPSVEPIVLQLMKGMTDNSVEPIVYTCLHGDVHILDIAVLYMDNVISLHQLSHMHMDLHFMIEHML